MNRHLVLVLTFIATALCPDGVLSVCPNADYVDLGGSCFLFINAVNSDWSDAELLCQSQNGYLAILDDCNVLGSVVDYITVNGLEKGTGYWIGGSDLLKEGDWKWIDDTSVATGAPFWSNTIDSGGSNEPNGGTAQNCAYMYSNDGFYFHDLECNNTSGMFPICQITPIEGVCQSPFIAIGNSCFQFIQVELNWDDSRTICQATGGDLAVIDECNLMAQVISYVQINDLVPFYGYWIGGTDSASEGLWTWVNGYEMKMGVPFWGKNGDGTLNPGNDTGHEYNCLYLNSLLRYRFDDGICTSVDNMSPLCQALMTASAPLLTICRPSAKLQMFKDTWANLITSDLQLSRYDILVVSSFSIEL